MKASEESVRRILRAYSKLTMRQHDVIDLHYGFVYGYNYTFDEIAKMELRMTREILTPKEVRRVEAMAIAKLAKALNKRSTAKR